MSRQLFLHHYLPAHLITALVAGVVFSFLFCGDTINYPVSVADLRTRRRPRSRAVVGKGMILAFVIANALIIAGFVFLAPLTYGTPGLSAEEVHNRRLLSTWTLVSVSLSLSLSGPRLRRLTLGGTAAFRQVRRETLRRSQGHMQRDEISASSCRFDSSCYIPHRAAHGSRPPPPRLVRVCAETTRHPFAGDADHFSSSSVLLYHLGPRC